MLTCFEIFLPLVRGAPPHFAMFLLEELAYDFCRRQWEQHIIYTEVRYCPHLLMMMQQHHDENEANNKANNKENNKDGDSLDTMKKNGDDEKSTACSDDDKDKDNSQQQQRRQQSAREVIDAVTRGLRRGCTDFDIIVNQILCAINWRPEWAGDILALACEFRNNEQQQPCGVVGIDIAAGEEHFDRHKFPHLYQQHFDMMQQAQTLGIPVAIHAGETLNGIDHVRQAVATYQDPVQPGYGAKRIGHGYRMTESVELMQHLAKEKIHVEICPTSSVETGGWIFHEEPARDTTTTHTNNTVVHNNVPKKKPWKDHPGLEMMKHGISFSLNSDDPAVFHTSLTWQYRIALMKMGLSREQIMQTNIHAIEAAFGPTEEKTKVNKELRSFQSRISAPGETVCNSMSTNQRFTDRVRDPF
jgi:adenosine deaminase